MNKEQTALLRQVHAENAVIFSFMQAVIASHHSPRVLLEAFNLAHDQLIGPLLADPAADDEALARIEDQRALLVSRLEARLRSPRQDGGAGKA